MWVMYVTLCRVYAYMATLYVSLRDQERVSKPRPAPTSTRWASCTSRDK